MEKNNIKGESLCKSAASKREKKDNRFGLIFRKQKIKNVPKVYLKMLSERFLFKGTRRRFFIVLCFRKKRTCPYLTHSFSYFV
jgi:hypothetical protein